MESDKINDMGLDFLIGKEQVRGCLCFAIGCAWYNSCSADEISELLADIGDAEVQG